MSAMLTTSHARLRWLTLGLVAGLVVGLASGWWLARNKSVQFGSRPLTDLINGGPTLPPSIGGADAADRSEPKEGEVSSSVRAIPITDDLREAFRAVMKSGDAAERQKAVHQLMLGLPTERWPELLAAVERMNSEHEFDDAPEGIARGIGAFEEVMSQMARIAPEASLRELAKHSGTARDVGFDRILRHWASADIEGAVAFYEQWKGLDQSTLPAGAASAIAKEYVKQDPQGALDWLATLSADDRAEATRQAFQALAFLDLEKALHFLVSQPDVPNREGIASQLAAGWAQIEPDKAFAWASQLPVELSARALEGTVRAWVNVDWDAAYRAVRAAQPSLRAGALPSLADPMLPERLAPMAELLINEPASRTQVALLEQVASAYQHLKPEEGSVWLAQLAPGSQRDAAIQGFIRELDQSDPEAAATWASTISDAESRISCLQDKVVAWLTNDPIAARQWVQTTARLNEADRTRLLLNIGR